MSHKATKRPRPRRLDRILWVVLSKVWPRWKTALVIVKPNTVVAWHRQGFRLFWRWKSRRRAGRPPIDKKTRALIQEMYTANVAWGAPRIHGELGKLGIVVDERTVGRLIAKMRQGDGTTPSQT